MSQSQQYRASSLPQDPNSDVEDRATETSPLLGQAEGSSGDAAAATERDSFRLTKGAAYGILAVFLLEISNQILAYPLRSLYERAVCEDYYRAKGQPGRDLNEAKCRIAAVQIDLVKLQQWDGLFTLASAIIVALPLGYFADRYDKRRVMAVVFSGMLAAFLWPVLVVNVHALPTGLLRLTPLFSLFGGGRYGASIVFSTMIVNAASEVDRTQTLLFLYSVGIATELAGPSFATATIKTSIWIPFATGLVALLLSFAAVALIPREPPFPKSAISNDGDETGEEEGQSATAGREGSKPFKETATIVLSFFKQRNMVLALLIFVALTLRAFSLWYIFPLVLVKMDARVDHIYTLLKEVAAIKLAFFLLVLPLSIQIVRYRYKPHPQVLNAYIIRYSLVDLAVGSILLFLVPSIWTLSISLAVYVLGFGARVALLSMISSWFDASIRARLFSVVVLVELCTRLISAVVLQSIASALFRLPNIQVGIPFLLFAAVYFLATLCSWFIKVPTEEENPPREAVLTE